jgi:hypothetical protein
MKCPVCEGQGDFEEYIDGWLANAYDCAYCEGTGNISIIGWLMFHFWEHMPDWILDAAYRFYEIKEFYKIKKNLKTRKDE